MAPSRTCNRPAPPAFGLASQESQQRPPARTYAYGRADLSSAPSPSSYAPPSSYSANFPPSESTTQDGGSKLNPPYQPQYTPNLCIALPDLEHHSTHFSTATTTATTTTTTTEGLDYHTTSGWDDNLPVISSSYVTRPNTGTSHAEEAASIRSFRSGDNIMYSQVPEGNLVGFGDQFTTMELDDDTGYPRNIPDNPSFVRPEPESSAPSRIMMANPTFSLSASTISPCATMLLETPIQRFLLDKDSGDKIYPNIRVEEEANPVADVASNFSTLSISSNESNNRRTPPNSPRPG